MGSELVFFAIGLVVVVLVLYFFFPQQLVAVALRATRRILRFKFRSIDVDGNAWPYLDGGPESAEIVLLLHGFGGDKDNWPLYARILRRKYRVLIPDLPAFGENTRDPGADYGMNAQVERLHAFVSTMGIKRLHVAGHSMGGFLALKYALAHPGEIITIALLNNAGVSSPNRSEVELAARRGENLLVVSSTQEFRQLIDFVTHRSLPLPAIVIRDIGARAVESKDLWDPIFWSLFDEILNRPLDDQLQNITVPTLIIWGRHDRVIDISSMEVMKSKLVNNHCVVFEDVGHVPILERPTESASAHLDFLNQHRAA